MDLRPNDGRSRKRRVQRTTRGSAVGVLTKDFRDLLALQRQQIRFGQPNTQDVIYPMIKQKNYTISCNYNVGTVNLTTSIISLGYTFQLTNLPAYSSLTGCFDRYRVLCWNLQFNPVQLTAGAQYTLPLVTALDYDDAGAAGQELQQRDTALVVPIGQYFERTLNPRVALAAYSTAFTSYANFSGKEWFDCGSPNIQFYCCKVYCGQTAASSTPIYSVSARVLLQFKNNF